MGTFWAKRPIVPFALFADNQTVRSASEPSHSMTRCSRLKSKRSERGAVMVEAAFIVPILALLTFGMIELGLGIRAADDAEGAARAGARVASQSGEVDDMAAQVASAASAGLKNMTSAEPVRLRVYRANPDNGQPDTSVGANCTANCTEYSWDAATKTFTRVTPTAAGRDGWPINDRYDANNQPRYVGVEVVARYSPITGFTNAITPSRRVMYRLEPKR